LYFISPSQINYVVPDQTSVGTATVTVTKNGQTVGSGTIQVAAIAPGLFAANGNGQGAASALAVKYPAQTWQSTATCPAAGNCVTVPFDVGTAATPVYLELFGTGIRGSKSSVTATIGTAAAAATWAVQAQYPGMDQVTSSSPPPWPDTVKWAWCSQWTAWRPTPSGQHQVGRAVYAPPSERSRTSSMRALALPSRVPAAPEAAAAHPGSREPPVGSSSGPCPPGGWSPVRW